MNEFEMIARYFRPLTQGHDALANDAAVLSVPAGHELVVSSDTLNAGVHFMADAGPADIAHKALRASISDLAAMGARPYAYQMCAAFPGTPDAAWLGAFRDALLLDQARYGIFCSGGDTTSTLGPLSISMSVMGLVKVGEAWGRSGAREGDKIVLSGPVGDAWIGLQILKGALSTDDDAYFIRAYYQPDVRFLDVPARAGIDISDGLAADLGHVCVASGVGAQVSVRDRMFSDPAWRLIESGTVHAEQLLTGGDDYCMIMAIAPEDVDDDMPVIGTFDGEDVCIRERTGDVMMFDRGVGWSHF